MWNCVALSAVLKPFWHDAMKIAWSMLVERKRLLLGVAAIVLRCISIVVSVFGCRLWRSMLMTAAIVPTIAA